MTEEHPKWPTHQCPACGKKILVGVRGNRAYLEHLEDELEELLDG